MSNSLAVRIKWIWRTTSGRSGQLSALPAEVSFMWSPWGRGSLPAVIVVRMKGSAFGAMIDDRPCLQCVFQAASPTNNLCSWITVQNAKVICESYREERTHIHQCSSPANASQRCTSSCVHWCIHRKCLHPLFRECTSACVHARVER